jgi:hypothetical protein
MKNHIVTALFAVAFIGLSVSKATAQDAGVDFEKQVLPILKSKCFKCHEKEHEDGGKIKKPKGGLRLDGADMITKGGKEHKDDMIVAGKSDASYLIKSVTLPASDDAAMPPEGKGDRLSDAEVATLKKWIDGGAKFGAWKGES